MRDASIPALTEGPLPSADTIAGAFIRDLEARLAELEAGEGVWLTGPLGNGFTVTRQPLLVGGGIGAAPLLALQDDLGPDTPVLLGFRSAAHAKAAEMGVAATVAVIYESGVLKAFGRMDGAALVTVSSAQDKAFTAVGFGIPSHAWYPMIKDDPALLHGVPSSIERVVIFGGGIPLRCGGELVGGLGVGGGSHEQDREIGQNRVAGNDFCKVAEKRHVDKGRSAGEFNRHEAGVHGQGERAAAFLEPGIA